MIKQVYSRRLKRKVYRLDAKPTHGKRFRRFFLRRSEAEAVAYKLKHDAIMKRFGLPTTLDRPMLSDLFPATGTVETTANAATKNNRRQARKNLERT